MKTPTATDQRVTLMPDEQIRLLKDSAAAMGDDMTFCLCVIALEGSIDSFEERFGGGGFDLPRSARAELETLTTVEARARVARVLHDVARKLDLPCDCRDCRGGAER